MPIATPQAYRQMIDTAKSQSFAFPAVNCVGSEAVNAALKGFAGRIRVPREAPPLLHPPLDRFPDLQTTIS